MLDRAIWLFAAAGAFGVFLSATAQSDTAASRDAAAPADDAPVITPRRSQVKTARTAAAAPAAPVKSAGPVDWQAVDAEVQKMEASDAEYQRQVRAMELTRKLTDYERDRMRPRGLRAAAPRDFQQVSSSEVAEARVPVLIPMTAETRGMMKVAARENAFTAFGETPHGDYVEIIGTRMRVVGGSTETLAMRRQSRKSAMPTLAALDAPYTVSHHEQGVDLSFSRFNVAYQISVYCKDPAGDEHCAGDGYVLSLADNLALLNREEGAQQ